MAIDAKSRKLSEEELEVLLLHKFVIKGAWQKYHIYESDVPKGFPLGIRNDVMKTAYNLKRKGLLASFPHGREHVWVLNKERSADILEKIKKFFPEEYA